jgi:hypothetical protein
MPTIRDADIDRFTAGDCHIFARRLAAITGWTLATFGTDEDHPVDHAFVIHPSGDAVDIQGRRSLAAFQSDWDWLGGSQRNVIRWPTWGALAAFDGLINDTGDWSRPDLGNYSYLRAAQLAPVVAAC